MCKVSHLSQELTGLSSVASQLASIISSLCVLPSGMVEGCVLRIHLGPQACKASALPTTAFVFLFAVFPTSPPPPTPRKSNFSHLEPTFLTSPFLPLGSWVLKHLHTGGISTRALVFRQSHCYSVRGLGIQDMVTTEKDL